MAARTWRTFAAAATGQTHAAAGAGSSDAHAIAAYPPGGAILIVADGLGAADEGALAARMSVSCALSVLVDVESSPGSTCCETTSVTRWRTPVPPCAAMRP